MMQLLGALLLLCAGEGMVILALWAELHYQHRQWSRGPMPDTTTWASNFLADGTTLKVTAVTASNGSGSVSQRDSVTT